MQISTAVRVAAYIARHGEFQCLAVTDKRYHWMCRRDLRFVNTTTLGGMTLRIWQAEARFHCEVSVDKSRRASHTRFVLFSWAPGWNVVSYPNQALQKVNRAHLERLEARYEEIQLTCELCRGWWE